MKTKTDWLLGTMHVLFWLIFIGLLIKTGAIIIGFVLTFINPEAAKNIYLGMNFSGLYSFNIWHYTIMGGLVICVSALKAYISGLVIKIFLKTDFNHPFNIDTALLLTKISYVALGTGILSLLGSGYSELFTEKGVHIGHSWGSGEFLFLAGIIFIIAHVFKKGTEIQSENELTI